MVPVCILNYIFDSKDVPSILIVDPKLSVVGGNRNLERILGLNIQNYVGKHVDVLEMPALPNHITAALATPHQTIGALVGNYYTTYDVYDGFVIIKFVVESYTCKRNFTDDDNLPIGYSISEYHPEVHDLLFVHVPCKNQLMQNINLHNSKGKFTTRDCNIDTSDLIDWLKNNSKTEQKFFQEFSRNNITVRASSHLFDNPHSDKLSILTYYEDITHTKKIEQELEAVQEKFEKVMDLQKPLLIFCENVPLQMGITQVIEENGELDIIMKYANPSSHHVLNYPQNFVNGKKLSEIGHISKVAIQDLVRDYNKAKALNGPYSYEKEFKTYTGSRWFSVILIPVQNNEFIYISKDITQRKMDTAELQKTKDNLEEMVTQKTRELREAMEVKSRFLAMMSHEIRTPLSGIMGSVNLLEESKLSMEQKDLVHTAQVCGEQLLVVINDILDLTKMEENKMPIDKSPCSLRNIIEESFEIVSLSAEQKDINLIYDLESRIPNTIIADPIRLRQIFVNLLSNSCKFSSSGDVILKAKLEAMGLADSSLCRIEFSVKDQGIGIPESAQSKIFQPFYQADDRINRKFGGSGLGLAISKRIAELHGGTMWFHSVQNKGTTFYFTIQVPYQTSAVPKAPTDYAKALLIVSQSEEYLKILKFKLVFMGIVLTEKKEEADIVFVETKLAKEETIQYFSNKKVPIVLMGYRNNTNYNYPLLKFPIKESALQSIIAKNADKPKEIENSIPIADPSIRLLVAEDNLMNQIVIKKILCNIGYNKITVVENGQKATEAIAKYDFDIILMDCMMPIMSGIEATEIIRKTIEANRQPFIIALTADAFKENANNCIAAGMNGVVTKPINKVELAEQLKKYSDLARTKAL